MSRVGFWSRRAGSREVGRTHQQIVVEETPTTAAVFIFGGFACLALIARDRIGVVLALVLGSIALYAAVRSTFVADRNRHVLLIKRRILFWTFERVYEASAIDRIYVRYMGRGGSGLAVRFKSGRSKSLTMSLGSGRGLDGLAGALNHFLYTTRSK